MSVPLPADHLRGELKREPVPRSENRPKGPLGLEDVELWQLPDAGKFSRDSALEEPIGLIEEFRRQPASQLLNELVRPSDGEFFGWDGQRAGRPPMTGDWPALFLGYVADGAVAIQKFRHKLPGTGLLEVCGFKEVPSRQLIDLRFSALEERAEAFDEVTRELIRHAKGIDSRIGLSVFVDSTAFHSASELRHECEDADACARAGGTRRARLRRATAAEISEQHFLESEAGEPTLDNDDEASGRTRGPIITEQGERGPIAFRSFDIKGHRYLSSGIRWYDNPGRFWLGGYQQAAVDMYTGFPVSLSIFPADVQEWDGFPPLFEGMVAALGMPPRIVSVDRGFVRNALYEYCGRRGVAVVAPFRKRSKGEELRNRRTDAFDEHGVPRCKFCGGPGDQTELALTFNGAGEPLLRFRCLVPRTHDCYRTQRLSCASDWVQLPLLLQQTALFQAVRHAHHNKEGQFQHDRRRYATIGKEGLGRICRSGIAVHRLRCSAALLLNWFRLSLRQGWLDPVALEVTHNPAEPIRLSGLSEGIIGTEKLDELLRYQDEEALELPYGSAAHRLRQAYLERV